MKKFLLIFFLLGIFFPFTGCDVFGNHTEKYNIGDIPPEVHHVSQLPSGYPVASTVPPAKSFADFEDGIKNAYTDDNVILECEMTEGGTLIKSFEDNNEHGYGNYCSFVLTPVRIIKIHYQGEENDMELNEGDIVYVKENYFWVTTDMDEVLEEYQEGTYLTCDHYYPMMLGERYIVYADVETLDDYGVSCDEPVLYPYNGSSVYCISEDVIHYQRQKTYNWFDFLYQTGAWLKYSGKTNFEYEYAEFFCDIEKSVTPVVHIDKSPLTLHDNVEDKRAHLEAENNGYGVILKCTVESKDGHIPVDIPYLHDYEYCMQSTVEVNKVFYSGKNVSSKVTVGATLQVYEPYYQPTEEHETYITHSRYFPVKNNERILFAYAYEHNGKTVLIPSGQAATVSTAYMVIPEHMQITLGPEGLLCYLETYAAYEVYNGIEGDLW